MGVRKLETKRNQGLAGRGQPQDGMDPWRGAGDKQSDTCDVPNHCLAESLNCDCPGLCSCLHLLGQRVACSRKQGTQLMDKWELAFSFLLPDDQEGPVSRGL